MTNTNNKERIRHTLAAMPQGEFAAEARDLLAALGYRSERTVELSGRVDEFVSHFAAENENIKTEQAFRDNVESVRILFQVTNAEIAVSPQTKLFNTDSSFDEGNIKSFIFIACELKGKGYPRGQYAQFTREINKRLSQPTVVLFQTTDHRLTLAFVHRREHKRDRKRDVLGNVSLIREIDPVNPHRAHLDILAELSLEERLRWIKFHDRSTNFDGLLAAWLVALDTEELNKRFYRDLFTWFERAVSEAKFPENEAKILPTEEHAIRLITRLLFVWFIKEKGLIADELFIEERILPLLKNYDRTTGDSYYRAVLQNLFFATLNTAIDKRNFSKEKNATHRNFSLYRYRSEIRDPEKLLALFAQTPFINGGLFDCLDSEKARRAEGYRIDCFTDNPNQRRSYSIPNRLFFDDSSAKPGLIILFGRYKFTVEENTPIEQEVALDPELLGKVFENLLAAYNPETRDTARKQTGSYYTPRAVVDYMVDEALVAMLAERVQPSISGGQFWCERLHYLLDHADAFNDADELFQEDEAEAIVRAISEIKALDPAVGSGVFPMGILHKLTLALRRLDPNNNLWEQIQKERARAKADAAFETRDRQERDAELLEISETFERYSGNFGRKLYLIQNSIFGVDIQPVACQIAKLRFFISLAIEQEPDETAENFGIKPLPNLETRFVAANTLNRIESQFVLMSARAKDLERKLHDNRERHFHATTRQQKLKCKQKDEVFRAELATELRNLGFPPNDADKIAQWDPYDQNAKADWFGAEYMFGEQKGFDLVIGNPPYIQLQKDGGKLGKLYGPKKEGKTTLPSTYQTFARTGDIYQLFCERGCQLLTPAHGLLVYITSNSWLKAQYGKALRRYFAELHTPLRLLEMGKDVFENTIVDTSVLLLREGVGSEPFPAVDMDKLPTKDFPPDDSLWGQARPDGETPWTILSSMEQRVMDKMLAKGTPLGMWDVRINRGILTGYNMAFIIDDETRRELIAEDPNSADIIKPILRGRDIQRYHAQRAGLWLITSFPSVRLDIDDYPAVKKHLVSFGRDRLEQSGKRLAGNRKSRKKTQHSWFELQDTCAYHKEFAKEKLFWMDLTERGRFAYSKGEMFCANTAYVLSGSSIKCLCAVLNSHLITWFMKHTALNSGMGVTRWVRFTVERLPIPKITAAEQHPFVSLVDSILAPKATDPSADTGEQEREIDRLVYELYGLSSEEIAAVENNSWACEKSDE